MPDKQDKIEQFKREAAKKLREDRKRALYRFSKTRRFKFLVVFIFAFCLDIYLVQKADEELLRTNAGLHELLETVTLDYSPNGWGSYGEKQCFFKYIYLIYGYQVCFDPGSNNVNGVAPLQERYFTVHYIPPQSKFALILRGDGPDNYYFSNWVGYHLSTVFYDGRIEDYSSLRRKEGLY